MPDTGKALRLLAFDYGAKRIGVAVGQRVTGNASALTTLPNRQGQPDWDGIAKLVQEWAPDAFVVGWPTHENGGAHEMWPQIERFCRQLATRFRLPVNKIDEYLSSHEAHSYARDNRGGLDAVSAEVILASWLRLTP